MSKRKKKLGLPPGSVVFTGNKRVEKIVIHYFQYDEVNLTEKKFNNHSEVTLRLSPDDKVDWYDMRGLHDTELVEQFGKMFDVHPLILEDIPDTHQRPKYEEYENGNFVIVRALNFNKETVKVQTEQVALFFRKGLVLSFQETDSDLFESVRKRIEAAKGRIRKFGADYLVYSLIDVLEDNYFYVLEEIEDVIENLEDRILLSQEECNKADIHNLKKELLLVRKSISPLREAISRLAKSDSPFIEETTTIFIRNLYDHTIQIMDIVESYRDILNGLQDLYISELSFKMNQVMQLLTLIATIFIPLTFFAGIYGMNFDYMPELHWKYAYFVLWGIMIFIFFALIYFFKKKRWI